MNETNSAITAINSELSHAGENARCRELRVKLVQDQITPEKAIPQMEFLFKMFCKPCFPRGELVAVAGKAKSGKTFISSILMTLCFREEVLSLRRNNPNQLKVLWFDTEQSAESTQDILRNRIIPMITGYAYSPLSLDFSPESFQVFNVRGEFFQNRLPMLEVAIGDFAPDLVILDGIRDLVNDINDGVIAQNVIERLMKLASDGRCCIVCVLHQNKAAEDKNLRGTIGSELSNKAFEVYECVKDENRIFSFAQTKTRKYDILDTLKYIVDAQGIPQLASIEHLLESEQRQRPAANSSRPELNRAYILEWNDNKPVFNIQLVFHDAMPEQGTLYITKDLQEAVMKETNITSPYFYNSLREKALADGVIVKTTNEYNHICYFRPVPSTTPHTMSPLKGDYVLG